MQLEYEGPTTLKANALFTAVLRVSLREILHLRSRVLLRFWRAGVWGVPTIGSCVFALLRACTQALTQAPYQLLACKQATTLAPTSPNPSWPPFAEREEPCTERSRRLIT